MVGTKTRSAGAQLPTFYKSKSDRKEISTWERKVLPLLLLP